MSWWVDPAKAETLQARAGTMVAVGEPKDEGTARGNIALILAAAATLVLALWIGARVRARRKG
jgi:hypothetical protein